MTAYLERIKNNYSMCNSTSWYFQPNVSRCSPWTEVWTSTSLKRQSVRPWSALTVPSESTFLEAGKISYQVSGLCSTKCVMPVVDFYSVFGINVPRSRSDVSSGSTEISDVSGIYPWRIFGLWLIFTVSLQSIYLGVGLLVPVRLPCSLIDFQIVSRRPFLACWRQT